MPLFSREEPPLGGLYSALRQDRPDPVTRQRLRRRVLGALESREPAGRLAARWLLSAPAALAAAAMFLLAGGLWLFQDGRDAPEPLLSVQANGGVHLQWSDVGKGTYRVLASTDPADFSAARSTVVRGTSFVDRAPSEAQIVYYRVE